MRSVQTAMILVFCALFMGSPSQALDEKTLTLRSGLAAKAYAENTPIMLNMELRNEGHETIRVLSHVATHEKHLDWFEVRIEPRDDCGLLEDSDESRTIRFTGDRDKSASVIKTLRYNNTIVHQVNLQTWALRQINGKRLIPYGCYWLEASYRVEGEKDVWNGHIASPRIPFDIKKRQDPVYRQPE
ncbi:MAG: hypothetical protein JRF33_01465 [Deltaproteobacteria bacterium]|nr:hypothetical protein [Deltaproteobacteria bacterium]